MCENRFCLDETVEEDEEERDGPVFYITLTIEEVFFLSCHVVL
jgi:hypothetical protein